jgi:hypothetical protein
LGHGPRYGDTGADLKPVGFDIPPGSGLGRSNHWLSFPERGTIIKPFEFEGSRKKTRRVATQPAKISGDVTLSDPDFCVFALEDTMERRFVTTKRHSNIDQRSLARRLAEIRELRKLVREAEASTRLKRRETRLARRHSFAARDNI